MYKAEMNISNAQSSVFLFNCLDQDLRDDILSANPGTQIGDMPEDDLTAAVKTLAVKLENKLVHRIRIGQSKQSHQELPRHIKRPGQVMSISSELP